MKIFRFSGLLGRIYAVFLVIALAALASTALIARQAVHRFHLGQVEQDLNARAQMAAMALAAPGFVGDPSAVDAYCKEVGGKAGMRCTVVTPDGRVIGDTHENPRWMENHGDRPEIKEALTGRLGSNIRYSDTMRRRLMYVAVPVQQQDHIRAVVRVSMPIEDVDTQLRHLNAIVVWTGSAMALLFAVTGYWWARRVTRPVRNICEVAKRLAAGERKARAMFSTDADMAVLAETVNHMADELDARIEALERQRNEYAAVLASMGEGVVALDREGRVLEVNPAGARFLAADVEKITGRSMVEVVRDPALADFMQKCMDSDEDQESPIEFSPGPVRILMARGRPLLGMESRRIGTLIVLQDMTRMKRLETVRQDFVANASHELKTPVTAIKACIEALSDGGGEDVESRRRFMDMLRRHACRLEAILKDLLTLSRLEHDAAKECLPVLSQGVFSLLNRVAEIFSDRARKKRMDIVIECSESLNAEMDSTLMEQAVGNLVDNAVKYGPEGSRVTLSAEALPDAVAIHVQDCGPGIESQHAGRIFERFYRVDPARSRAMGGTGLGLAIVRHIAQAHGGDVQVNSVPGKGSVFTVWLPSRR